MKITIIQNQDGETRIIPEGTPDGEVAGAIANLVGTEAGTTRPSRRWLIDHITGSQVASSAELANALRDTALHMVSISEDEAAMIAKLIN